MSSPYVHALGGFRWSGCGFRVCFAIEKLKGSETKKNYLFKNCIAVFFSSSLSLGYKQLTGPRIKIRRWSNWLERHDILPDVQPPGLLCATEFHPKGELTSYIERRRVQSRVAEIRRQLLHSRYYC